MDTPTTEQNEQQDLARQVNDLLGKPNGWGAFEEQARQFQGWVSEWEAKSTKWLQDNQEYFKHQERIGEAVGRMADAQMRSEFLWTRYHDYPPARLYPQDSKRYDACASRSSIRRHSVKSLKAADKPLRKICRRVSRELENLRSPEAPPEPPPLEPSLGDVLLSVPRRNQGPVPGQSPQNLLSREKA